LLSARWTNKRKPHWDRLAQLLDRAGNRGVRTLSHPELQELGLLYRQTASDLAAAREDQASQPLSRYLNQMLARAHNLVYMGRRSNPGGIRRFYSQTYPGIFRATFRYTLLAFGITAVAAIAGALLTLHDPAFPRYVLGPRMVETIEKRQMWTDSVVTIAPLASSAIMSNNLTVAFSAFASGILAGLGTVWVMFTNGLLLGTVTMACAEAGMAGRLYTFVAAHGVLELPAIFIAGGAGLLLGRGLLFPGLLPRRESLAERGSQATKLALGTIPLLILAGLIEGFISPSNLPPYVKFLFAGAGATLLTLYLSLAGRATAASAAERSKDPSR